MLRWKSKLSAQAGNSMLEYGLLALLLMALTLPGFFSAGGQLKQWTGNLSNHIANATSRNQGNTISQTVISTPSLPPMEPGETRQILLKTGKVYTIETSQQPVMVVGMTNSYEPPTAKKPQLPVKHDR